MATDFLVAHFLQRPGSITRDVNFDKKKKMIYDILKVILSINNFTESKITKNSIAYIPIKRRISSLTATLLLQVMKNCKTMLILKEVMRILKDNNLYPSTFKAQEKNKQIFLDYINKYFILYILSFLFTMKNKIFR